MVAVGVAEAEAPVQGLGRVVVDLDLQEDPGYRRQGLGAAITAAACEHAARRAVARVFLQVEVNNEPAQALYRGLGFRYSHRYHYRVAPA